MTPARYERVREVFLAVRARPAAEQADALRELCAGDTALLAEVQSLLRTEAAGDTFLQTPALGAAFALGNPESIVSAADAQPSGASREAPASDVLRALPARIGQYRVLDILGEGGMGIVCRARQEHPDRVVALKVIKPTIESAEARRRFVHETEVLGWLQHPGIAHIFDAGTVEIAGILRPFFAMELVHGQPITEFALARSLAVRERLELFARVCDAIQHAHQKGVIHRDIKPGNILVTPDGQPKVLDFGVARVLASSDQGLTAETHVGQVLGTLAYMSPEQISGDIRNLDTRTDVYALGVTLHELLTGHMPINLSGKSIVEAARLIAEHEPTRCRTYNRQIPADVEVIVQKALQKDKNHRYASASDLAADIRRVLTDQPISARSPSALYHLYKLARRHRAPFAGAAVALLALIWGLVQTTLERNRALRAERAAQVERDEAERQTAIATAVNAFLNDDLLGAATPARALGRDATVRQVLDRASASIGDRFAGEPLIEAAVQQSIGDAYGSLGLYEPAITHLSRAVALYESTPGADEARLAASLDRLGLIQMNAGDYAEAERLLPRAIAIRQRVLGVAHEYTLEAQNHLVLLYSRQGRRAEQERLLLEILDVAEQAHGRNHGLVGLVITNLADLYGDEGRYADAEPLFLDALAFAREKYGPEHPSTLTVMHNLAAMYTRQDRLVEALPLAEGAVEARRRILGEEHPRTLMALTSLGTVYKRMGRLAEAERLFRLTLEAKERTLGSEHPDALVSMNNLAGVLILVGAADEAECLLERVVETRTRVLGPEHPQTRLAADNLSELRQTASPTRAEAGSD